MSEEVKTVEENLATRQKRVDLYAKIMQSKADKTRFKQEERKRFLENERLEIENEKAKEKDGGGWNTPTGELMRAIQLWVIDNDSAAVGSDPVLKSVWTEEEMFILKKRLLKKLGQL